MFGDNPGVLWTQSLAHIRGSQAFERGVAIVKMTADKCISNHDGIFISEMLPNASVVKQKSKTTFTESGYMCI